MTAQKPKPQKTYITIRDPASKESKHVVLYDATVDQVENHIRRIDGNTDSGGDKPTTPARRISQKQAA